MAEAQPGGATGSRIPKPPRRSAWIYFLGTFEDFEPLEAEAAAAGTEAVLAAGAAGVEVVEPAAGVDAGVGVGVGVAPEPESFFSADL